MKVIVNLLIHPMTWLVIGCFILWIFRKKWKRKYIISGIVFLFMIFYATTTFFLPDKLTAYLEDQYPPLFPVVLDTSQNYNIIVLGGGVGVDARLPSTSLLEHVVLSRLVEGVRIFKNLPNSTLITSGNSSSGNTPQAIIVKQAAIELGVPDSLIFTQGEPTNTIEEADVYVKRFGTETPLIISTSAIHIPRAVYIFNKAGVKTIIAAPCDYKVKKDNKVMLRNYIKPNLSYMSEIAGDLHEIIGLWYAKRN